MTADWSCPDGTLVMTVEQAANREAWLAQRRLGIGGSDVAALMGVSRYETEFDVWRDKTGRGADREVSLQMEMGTRWEAAAADKWREDNGIEIQRRGMLQSKIEPVLRCNVDRLTADGGVLEIKVVNGFMKMPDLDNGYLGWPAHWFWQGVANIAVTGRSHCHLGVAIGNSDWVERVMYREHPAVQEALEQLFRYAPQWWERHVLGDEMPPMGKPPAEDDEEFVNGTKYEAIIPAMLLDARQRLIEVRELKRELEAEDKDLKAKLAAESGGAEWLLADGVPVLRFVPTKGRASFQKRALFGEAPVSGREMVKWLGEADWLTDEQSAQIMAWLLSHKMTEKQYTTTGDPGTQLRIVGHEKEE